MSTGTPQRKANYTSADVSLRREINLRLKLNSLPTTVYPPPLLRMAKDHALERGVVGPGVAPDGFIHVIGFDRRERFVEPQHVTPIGLAPARGRTTGAPVFNARIARLRNVPAGWPKKSTTTPSLLLAC